MSDAVLVAIIGGGFSVAVALLELTRRQNNRDHGRTTDKLDDVLISLQRVEKKTDRHGRNLRAHIVSHNPPKPPSKPPRKATR
jgi:hypothetical protein